MNSSNGGRAQTVKRPWIASSWRGAGFTGSPEFVVVIAIGVVALALSPVVGWDRVAIVVFCVLGAASGRWPLVAGALVAVSTLAIRWSQVEIGYAYLTLLVVVEAIGTTGRRLVTATAVVLGVVLWFSSDLGFAAALWDAAITAVLLCGAAAVGQLRYRTKDQRRRIEKMEAAAALGRRRIARDLHDGVAQELSLIVRTADRAQVLGAGGSATQAAFQQIATSGRKSIQDMRDALVALRAADPELDEGRPVGSPVASHGRSAVGAEVPRSRERLRKAGFTPDIHGGTLPVLPAEVDRCLASCLDELITNVICHGREDEPCIIRVDRFRGHAELVVVNAYDGRAIDSTSTQQGLQGVRERAALLGGDAVVGPVSDQRWRAQIQVPLK